MIKNKIYNEVGEVVCYQLPEYTLTRWGKFDNFNPEFLIIDSGLNDELLKFKLEFIGDVGLFYNDNISFSIQILAREGNYFYKEIYIDNDVRKNRMDLNSYFLEINKNKLKFDNEYILKLTFNIINDDNTIFNLSENTSNFSFGMGSKNNDYLVVLKQVDKPDLTVGSFLTPSISGLKTKSIITDKKLRSVALDFEFIGSLIVSIDGITMSEGYDYERKNKLIIFNDILPKDTVITITGFSENESLNGFLVETYLVHGNNQTPSKEKVKEGVFYDKSTQKFGVNLKKGVSTTSEPILILNGQQLLFKSDFYIDNYDNSIILLNGLLLEDDIISIYYIPEFITNEIIDNRLLLNITLDNPITNEEGFFELQISTNKDFNEYEKVIIDYVDGQGVYVFDLEYPSKGLRYIKVVNNKTYSLINKKEIKMNNESKIIKLIFK